MYFTQFAVASKIGPGLATGNTIVLKVKLSLHLPKFLEIDSWQLSAFGDLTPDGTQTRRPHQWSRFPAWCCQHHQWLWYSRSLLYILINFRRCFFFRAGHTVGQAIGEHPLIEKISFTGSTLTGRKILKASAESNLKDVTLELGGKSPTVIFDDADLDQAIKWASNGILYVLQWLDFSLLPNPHLSSIISLSISANMGACQSISVSMPHLIVI